MNCNTIIYGYIRKYYYKFHPQLDLIISYLIHHFHFYIHLLLPNQSPAQIIQMNSYNLQFILLPTAHYHHIKQLIKDLNAFIESFAGSADRSLFCDAIQKVLKHSEALQQICMKVSQQFEEGKINKKVLQTQIESLHENLQGIKQQVSRKDREIIKYSSQLMKISQQNERFKQYIRKIKQQNKGYKSEMEQLVGSLSSKVKRYKSEYEQKMERYEKKIQRLEGELQKSNKVGEDLDRELEELAMLEAEVEGQESNNYI